MNNKDESLSEVESFQIIQQMIDAAKQEQKDDGKGWILWGWMLFSASILTVINIQFKWFNTFFFWNFLGLFTLIAFAAEAVKNFFYKKRVKVKTYLKEVFKKLNIGFFICLMCIIIAMNVAITPTKGFALLISLYAFWILIYGTLLEFKPSVVGAYITWVFAIVAIFQNSFQLVMLLHAGAVLCGYIIPGHMANIRFKKDTSLRTSNRNSIV